ncbi:hypothetical protein DICA3_F39722 [Diutina catenulata]
MTNNKYNITKSEHSMVPARLLNASILTIVFLGMVGLWAWHGWVVAKIMYYQPYGSLINNLMYGPVTWVAHMGVSYRVAKWLNARLLDDKIEDDYKKYI